MTACCLLRGYLCVCVPVCVCLAHCQVASSQITLWAAAALRHRSQRSIYSKTFTPSPRTKTNSINLCYLRVHMINCCDTSVCDVEAVVANVSWQADRLWRYWHILHGASNKPTNSDFVLRFMRRFIRCCCSGWNCNHEQSNLEISAYGVSRRLNKSVCWNPCKSVWFATDNWELKAQRRLQPCIINIPFST